MYKSHLIDFKNCNSKRFIASRENCGYTLANSILTHRDPKGQEAKDASKFLDVLITEIDSFYEEHSDLLSKKGKLPHQRSRLPENKEWNANAEKYYEKNPRKRPRK